MRKSFRKSLDKIVAKRDSNNREDSADTEKNEDMTQDVGIMDEGNVPKNSPGTPIPSNTNLMLELNLKLENEDSEKAITTSATPPPIPSSPKPVFQDSPPSLPQVPKQRSTEAVATTGERPEAGASTGEVLTEQENRVRSETSKELWEELSGGDEDLDGESSDTEKQVEEDRRQTEEPVRIKK